MGYQPKSLMGCANIDDKQNELVLQHPGENALSIA